MGRRPERDAGFVFTVILVDSSAWIEYLRDTGTSVCEELDRLLNDEVAICDIVRMEILAGARDESHLANLRGLLARAVMIRILPTDYDDAAALYRHCRRRGGTVRKLVDCLIASVAIRVGVAVLHNDADFDTLARHTEMHVHQPCD
jgi:predicted nucleic acid-binding protein